MQLPYKYSLPFMTIMGSLHCMVSKSLFLVNITYYFFNYNGRLNGDDFTGHEGVIGYSPLAVICALVVSVLTIALPIALGVRKLDPGIPMARSRSTLISAACHPPPEVLHPRKGMQAYSQCSWVSSKARSMRKMKLGLVASILGKFLHRSKASCTIN